MSTQETSNAGTPPATRVSEAFVPRRGLRGGHLQTLAGHFLPRQDFNGKKIGVWRSDFQELSIAFLDKYGIQADIVPITSTINLFLKGGIDIMNVMWYNEYHRMLDAGLNPATMTCDLEPCT